MTVLGEKRTLSRATYFSQGLNSRDSKVNSSPFPSFSVSCFKERFCTPPNHLATQILGLPGALSVCRLHIQSPTQAPWFSPEPLLESILCLRSGGCHLWLEPPQSPNRVAASGLTSSTAQQAPRSKVGETRLHSHGSNLGRQDWGLHSSPQQAQGGG